MQLRESDDELVIETLPVRDWVGALVLVAVGAAGLLVAPPSADAGGRPLLGLLAMTALASLALGLVLALRARGTRASFQRRGGRLRIRHLGLLPSFANRELSLEAVDGVNVAVRSTPYGGARWRVCVSTRHGEVPLSRSWTDDRAACDQAARRLRDWLAAEHAGRT